MHIHIGNSTFAKATRLSERANLSAHWQSHRGQDETVYDILQHKEGGYFIDCAANDPVYESNSYSLEQYHGWRGLCIEGNAQAAWGLAHRACEVVVAVVGSGGDARFLQQTGVGGIIPGGSSGNARRPEDQRVQIRPTVPLASIMAARGSPHVIDYLSLDLEGAEDAALLDFPFNNPWTIRVVSVERPSTRLQAKLAEQGYYFLRTHGNYGDCMYVHRSVPSLAKTLARQRRGVRCEWPESEKLWDGCPLPHHIREEFWPKYQRCWKKQTRAAKGKDR